MTRQIVTLSNGLRVGNFSSPHDFTFEDGTVLPAVSDEVAERLKVKFIENERPHSIQHDNKVILTNDVTLDFQLTPEIEKEMHEWLKEQLEDNVDIILIPLPMMTALKKTPWTTHQFRCIRIKDRLKKEVSIDTFCI